MRRKTGKKILLGVIVAFFILSTIALVTIRFYTPNTIDVSDSNNDVEELELINEKPKISASWIRTTGIIINDTGGATQNWAWAVAQAWCSGAGSVGDPYLIENVTISKGEGNASISILDSPSTVYWTLNNVTVRDNVAGGIGIYVNNASHGSITASNCSLNGQSGIELVDVNSTTITDSEFTNNTRFGIGISEAVMLSVGNQISNNNFSGNVVNNGGDNSTTANTWDDGVDSGNLWADYGGVDADDDGIGDTAYTVSGTASATDRYPICDDGDNIAPSVAINTPQTDNIFITHPPSFTVTITDAVGVNSQWWTITGGSVNVTFTGSSGSITLVEWNRYTSTIEGSILRITFTVYANDVAGNEGSASVSIRKLIPAEEDEDSDDDVPDFVVEQVYITASLLGLFLVFKAKLYYKKLFTTK